MFLFALAMPVLITLLLQVVLLTLFESKPRLGVADLGESAITARTEALDGLEVTVMDSAAELQRLVEQHDVDAGLVLADGFDMAVTEASARSSRFLSRARASPRAG